MITPPTPLRPLAGITVFDAAEGIAGSRAAALLGESGARVVKIGRPEKNALSEVATVVGTAAERGVLWRYCNRGKEIWDIDITSPADRSDLRKELARADVLIHGWTNSQAMALGFSSEEIRIDHTGLITISVTPFGATGPRQAYQATDIVEMAMGGLMYSTPGFPDFVEDQEKEPPLRPSFDMAELITGVLAAAGGVEALLLRQISGEGSSVEISVQRAIASLLAWDYALWNYGGTLPGRNETRAGLSPNAFLPCADGHVVLVAFMQRHWDELVEIMGHPEWADSELFASPQDRGANWDALRPLLEMWLAGQKRISLMEAAQTRGIPTCAALTLEEAVRNEHVRSRRLYADDDSHLPGSAYVINGERMPGGEQSRPFDPSTLRTRMTPNTGNKSHAPLEGVRIVDFGHMVAVPLTAQWLAQMGAEVIQVESHYSMVTRQFAPIMGDPPENTSGIYNHINCNKTSVTLNLKDQRGVKLALDLIATADVVMENYSAGTMESIGLGYESLKRVRPAITLLSISAFGREGPWSHYNAMHSGILALSGLTALTGYEGGHGRMCGSILPDVLAACAATLGVSQAIYHQRATGAGQHLEIAMSEVVQTLMPEPVFEVKRFGVSRTRLGNRNPLYAPHGAYPVRGDDQWVAIAAPTEDQWHHLCVALGRPELANDHAFATQEARVRNAADLDLIISAWTRTQTAAEVTSQLQSCDVPAGPVMSVKDILEDPYFREIGFVQEVEHPQAGRHWMAGKPWSLLGACQPPITHAPLLGDGNDEVLTNLLGLDTATLQELKTEKVVY